MIKAVFFDIDGTLVSRHDLHIPPSVVKALDLLKAKGIKVGLATGRHKLELHDLDLLGDLTFDFSVMLNGQLGYDGTKLVYEKEISPQALNIMQDYSKTYQIPLQFIEEDDLYINMINDDVIVAQASIHTPVPPLGSRDQKQNKPVYQICIFCSKKYKALFDEIKDVRLTQWNNTGAYDCISSEGSKVKGIIAVLKPYDISLDEVMCFGDGDNDVEMLAACGIGVAMGDGSIKAKEAADFITDSADEDGIYHALEKLNIIY